MRFHLSPVTLIHIGRQNHQSVATGICGGFRQGDRFRRSKGRDRGHDRSPAVHGADAIPQDRDLLFKSKRRTLPERSERHNSSAAVIQQPLAVFDNELMIYSVIRVETGGDRGHYALPIHQFPPVTWLCSVSGDMAASVLNRVGKIGGRTESEIQPNKN